MDDALYFARQGFWLRMARERAGKSQAGAAEQIGLRRASKSTISDYENGGQVTPQPVLRTLARWYGVPVELFLNPPLTTDEVIERRIAELESRVADAELSDWREGLDRAQEADGERDDELDRESA